MSRVFEKPVEAHGLTKKVYNQYNQFMKKQMIDAIASSMCGFRLPRYQEIPDVGLYLEQTTKYINQCIHILGFEDVTGSMIRNYVKQGFITNPVKKQYSANQIAHLIALVLLKQVISLENVHALFQIQCNNNNYPDDVAYNYFCDELENILYFRFGLKDASSEVGVTVSLEKEMLQSALTAVSHIVYLNRCFHALSAPKSEEE